MIGLITLVTSVGVALAAAAHWLISKAKSAEAVVVEEAKKVEAEVKKVL